MIKILPKIFTVMVIIGLLMVLFGLLGAMIYDAERTRMINQQSNTESNIATCKSGYVMIQTKDGDVCVDGYALKK